jgi:hypothetical protein
MQCFATEERLAQQPIAWDTSNRGLPAAVPFQGALQCAFQLLPDDVWDRMRDWLLFRGEHEIWFFITEGSADELDQTAWKLALDELTFESLATLNLSFDCFLTAPGFKWAIRILHTGEILIGGPQELFELVRAGLEEADASADDDRR